MSSVSEYARIASAMANIASVLGDLAVKFETIEERNAVDDAMIDALVAASTELTASATALKSITYEAP